MLIATLLTNPLFYPIAIVVSAVGWVVYQRFYSPYAGIPGPFWASITRLWYLNRINDQEDLMHQHTKKLHKIYGSYWSPPRGSFAGFQLTLLRPTGENCSQ
jgi:hypothetical protein